MQVPGQETPVPLGLTDATETTGREEADVRELSSAPAPQAEGPGLRLHDTPRAPCGCGAS